MSQKVPIVPGWFMEEGRPEARAPQSLKVQQELTTAKCHFQIKTDILLVLFQVLLSTLLWLLF